MEKVQVNIILEILGRPAENVVDAIRIMLVRLGNEEGIKILDSVSHPPILAKDSKDLYTSFAEVTLELDSLDRYFGLILGYMPSNIEVINPEKVKLTNDQLNSLGNRLLQRLHDYDAITKKMIYERDIATNKLREIAPHLFKKKILGHPLQVKKIKKRKSKKE